MTVIIDAAERVINLIKKYNAIKNAVTFSQKMKHWNRLLYDMSQTSKKISALSKTMLMQI